jgi:hypothetical protein
LGRTPIAGTFSERLLSLAGILKITQCVKMPLGASGSSIISATLFVSLGAPLQVKGGEIPSPTQVYLEGMRPPSWNTGLVRTMPDGNCVTTVADVAKTIRVPVIDCWDTKDGDEVSELRIPTRTIPATTTTTIAKNLPLTIVTLRTKLNYAYITSSRNIHLLRTECDGSPQSPSILLMLLNADLRKRGVELHHFESGIRNILGYVMWPQEDQFLHQNSLLECDGLIDCSRTSDC